MIKFLDLKAVNQKYVSQFKVAFDRILESGWYLLGKELELFEENFAAYCRMKHAIGVASGLDALTLIVRAYGLGPGDEIMAPANTYIATIFAITNCGAKPVFIEPVPETHLMNLEQIEEKITERTKAIMPVHLYGRSCNMKEIYAIAEKYNLKIIDDAAQAHGAVHEKNEEAVSLVGRATAFSFYPGKNLGALSDAGAVLTNDSCLAEKIKALRNYGSEKKYYHPYLGSNSRMDELQAAFLNIKLKGLEQDNAARRKVAEYYFETIKNDKITLPAFPDDPESHVWHLFVITTKERDRLQQYLLENGIQTQIHYPVPPHKQQCYREYNRLSLPIAERLASEVLSLPISPVIAKEDVRRIVEVINDWK